MDPLSSSARQPGGARGTALALQALAVLGDPILRVLDRVPEMIRVAARDLASGSIDGTASPLAPQVRHFPPAL